MISYRLMPKDAYLAETRVEKWEENLQELFKTILQSTVAHLTPDDFLTWSDRFRLHQSSAGGLMLNNPDKENAAHWGHINLLLTQQLQDHVAPWGVLIKWVHIRDITLTPRAIAPVVTNANISMRAAAATTPPVQGQAQPSPLNMASSTAGRATVPPVMGNRVPPVVNKPAAEPRPAAAARTKPPNEEVLKNAYKQIQNGSITSPEAIRSIAAGFQAIADDPEANKNASFDAALAAQTLYERANLYEAQAIAASPVTPPVSASKAYREDVPTQSGWSYRTSSDDNMLAGG
jgi:regulator of protease activity HflC (stomatin/prohibitin superfamily)